MINEKAGAPISAVSMTLSNGIEKKDPDEEDDKPKTAAQRRLEKKRALEPQITAQVQVHVTIDTKGFTAEAILDALRSRDLPSIVIEKAHMLQGVMNAVIY